MECDFCQKTYEDIREETTDYYFCPSCTATYCTECVENESDEFLNRTSDSESEITFVCPDCGVELDLIPIGSDLDIYAEEEED